MKFKITTHWLFSKLVMNILAKIMYKKYTKLPCFISLFLIQIFHQTASEKFSLNEGSNFDIKREDLDSEASRTNQRGRKYIITSA